MLSDHKKFPERRFLVTEELPYYCGAEGISVVTTRTIRGTSLPKTILSRAVFFGPVRTTSVKPVGRATVGLAGLFDICMVEKPRAAFHRAMWNDEPMVRIAVRDNALDIDHGRDLWQWPNMAAIWNFPRAYEVWSSK